MTGSRLRPDTIVLAALELEDRDVGIGAVTVGVAGKCAGDAVKVPGGKENGLETEFIRKSKKFRKEKRIKKILRRRGTHTGLVHIFSAMEPCPAYRPWYLAPGGRQAARRHQNPHTANAIEDHTLSQRRLTHPCFL